MDRGPAPQGLQDSAQGFNPTLLQVVEQATRVCQNKNSTVD
jgi:hypothetical protein